MGLVPDAPRDLVSVEARKTDVDDGHFGTHGLQELESAVAAFRLEHAVASVLEHEAEHLACIATVLDQEDPSGHGRFERGRDAGGTSRPA